MNKGTHYIISDYIESEHRAIKKDRLAKCYTVKITESGLAKEINPVSDKKPIHVFSDHPDEHLSGMYQAIYNKWLGAETKLLSLPWDGNKQNGQWGNVGEIWYAYINATDYHTDHFILISPTT